MAEYDLRILQPSEFECFSRDLLQARERIFIESFADGPDKGVDFRFAYDKDKTSIIQCKRFKEWKELKYCLKNEVEKVKKLNPHRYILTTSVDLSVRQKEEIIKMFSPYILTGADVLGKKDLNHLLDDHKEIEQRYHKLWLASTNILNIIINRSTVNWSSFELENIKKDIRLYVENDSLEKALRILKENHYVIISGIPGIGKTTLARMLVYTMLAKGYEEFVYITDDMDNAAKMFNKERKQVFFFDDFLGSNSFVPQTISFENKLISFIEKVRNSQKTLFILSTREYVLSEAKQYYEKLSMSHIDIAKCTIELEYYTKTIRAKILYNHMAEADIPKEHIEIFLNEHGYRDIIDHSNFNPRVIESMIKEKVWTSIAPDDFVKTINGFFNNPSSVWQFAFEKLDIETRYALLVLGTMGKSVIIEDYEEAYRSFCFLTSGELGLTFDDVKWRRSLKVLSDCFIKIRKIENVKVVSLYNPSISDFIVSYLNENRNTARILLTGACYIDQLLNIFTDSKDNASKKNLVYVDKVDALLEESFNKIWEEVKTCRIKDWLWGVPEKDSFYETKVLLDLVTKFPQFHSCHKEFVENKYNPDELTWQSIHISYRLKLMRKIDWRLMYPQADEYLQKIIENETLDTDEWIELTETVKYLHLERDVISDYYYDRLDEDLSNEIDRFSDVSECQEEYEKVDSLKILLPDWQWFDAFNNIDMVEKRIIDKREHDEDDDFDYYNWSAEREKADAQIDEMFSALRVYT